MPITLSWTPPPGDSSPESPLETVSGLKEIRVLRAPLGSNSFELLATLLPSELIWQSNSYDDGEFMVVVVDNAGNFSEVVRARYPVADRTPPPPVTNVSISGTVAPPPPPTTTARVVNVVVDAAGANFSLTENNPAVSTLVEYLDDSSNGVWQTLTTLAAGVTTGRLNKTWVQGTHTFVCIRATQSGTTTEQDCRSLVSLFNTSPQLMNLTLNPTSLNGGSNSTGIVTISLAAPSGGYTVTLASSNASVATVPSSVVITQGNTQASFQVSTSNPAITTSVTISGTNGSSSVQATLQVARVLTGGEVGGDWPNEQTQLSLVSSHGFAGSNDGNGWTNYGPGRTSDATAPISPPDCARFTYPVGYGGGSGPGIIETAFSGKSEVYVAFKVKFSNPFDLPSGQGVKTIFLSYQSLSTAYVPIFYGTGTTMTCTLYNPTTVGINNGHVAGSWGDSPGTRNYPCSGNIQKGQWQTVEMYIKKSSSSISQDGQLKLWLNGFASLFVPNINTENKLFDFLSFSPIWAGVGYQKTSLDYLDFDHIIIRGA